jgi:AhpD family alkylhydroperoxidase
MSDAILTPKEHELVSLAASVGAGCRPCTAYHVKAVRSAGACERSVRLAIETALAGRANATVAIGEWADHSQGAVPQVDSEFRAARRLLMALMSVATAVTVNSAPDLEAHLAAAQQYGATREQLRAVVEIARQIQRVAQEKIEAITKRLDQPEPAAAAEPAENPQPAAARAGGCGCK